MNPLKDPNYRVTDLPPSIEGKITTFAKAAMDYAFVGSQPLEDQEDIEGEYGGAAYNLRRTILTELEKVAVKASVIAALNEPRIEREFYTWTEEGRKKEVEDYKWDARNEEGYPLNEHIEITGSINLGGPVPVLEDLGEIDKPFGQLDRATQLRLFEAWLEGDIIEAYRLQTGQWEEKLYPQWDPHKRYRVKSKPQRDIQVPWDYLPDWVQWVARDADGQVFLFLRRPEAGGNAWKPDDGSKMTQIYLKDVGNKPWAQSLIKRPTEKD